MSLTNADGDNGLDTPNQIPFVDPETLKFRRACKDTAQAYSIYQRLEQENRNRNMKAANIMQKFNDEPPYDQAKLKRNNQDWRHNVSTGFLGSQVSRMIPSFKDIIDQARYLTSSRFEDNYPDGNQKTEVFQKNITKLVRAWDDFDAFNYRLVLENILFGYSGACWTDEYDWRPIFCRQDESLFPEGAMQSVSQLPFWVKLQKFQQHELAEYLVEPETSITMGWNIENVVDAINNAQTEMRKSMLQSKVRKYEDTVRESTIGRSYTIGIKVIEAAHLFMREASGKISHYLFDTRNGDELMTRLDRFESMEQTLSLFSIEVGNDGRLHGSKGAGRRLYNTHVALDLATNNFSDNCYLASLLLLKATTKAKPIVALEVAHPIAYIPQEYEVLPQTIPINIEAFQALYTHKQALADMQVGIFMPGSAVQQTEEESASKTNYIASIEMQIRGGILRRFFLQYSLMIDQIQQRICSPDNIATALKQFQQEQASGIRRQSQKMFDFLRRIGQQMTSHAIVAEDKYENKEAIECLISMMREGLNPEEIFDLSTKSSNELTENRIDNSQALDQIGAQWLQDPSFNKPEFMKADISAKLGNAAVDRFVIPGQDNTLQAEGIRLQLMELTSLLDGEQIPISPRDDDQSHMQVIQAKVGDFIKKLVAAPVTDGLMQATNILQHYAAHMQSAVTKGAKPDSISQNKQWFLQMMQGLNQVKALLSQQPVQPAQLPPGLHPAVHSGHPNPHVRPPHEPKQSATNLAANQMRDMPQAGLPNGNILPLSRGAINLTPAISEQQQTSNS
jgi:hypothetical protein